MAFSRVIFALGFFLSISMPGAQASGGDLIAAVGTARKAFELSEYTKAVQILEDAASSDPQNAEIQFWLLRSYFELEQSDKAVRSGERAVALAPQNSEHHHSLGKAYGEKADRAMCVSALSLPPTAHIELDSAEQPDGPAFAARKALVVNLC